METRINKYIAQSGSYSRREADELIRQGKVAINNRKAELGDVVTDADKVSIDGEVIQEKTDLVYIIYHKPYGVISTTAKDADNTVIDDISYPTRIFPIGRLDVRSTGLLLLTNDGSVVNDILKAVNKVEKEYIVEIDAKLSPTDKQLLERGIDLNGVKTLPSKVQVLSSNTISITITEGKNRQVRRMFEKLGYEVISLHRVRIGELILGKLKPGEYREMNADTFKSKLGIQH